VKLLVVGSGGREHALVWKLKKSKHVSKIFWAPGNGGADGLSEALPIAAESLQEIIKFTLDNKIDFVVVGPEAPLTLGLVDLLEEEGVKTYGPSKKAARLESSKIFTKEFCVKYSIPTSGYWIFTDSKKAEDFLKSSEAKFPIVLKADGLAAGKGVIIAKDIREAKDAVNKIMVEKEFGEAGSRLLIEEFLAGEEASVMAVCDGENSVILPTARDFKRALDSDKGLNTGGMGAISPAPIIKEDQLPAIKKTIFDKTLMAMAAEGNPFKGTLYAGLMLTQDGPKLLEFNARFGDPETQAVIPRIKSDLFELLYAASEGKLGNIELEISPEKAVSVVATSKGYPGSYQKGFRITGIKEAENCGSIVFHAGTSRKDGNVFTNGGRVLNITALGDTVARAREMVYKSLSYIKFEGITFRSDIALKQ
jgi:phosphoribosylamine---glycine ligase